MVRCGAEPLHSFRLLSSRIFLVGNFAKHHIRSVNSLNVIFSRSSFQLCCRLLPSVYKKIPSDNPLKFNIPAGTFDHKQLYVPHRNILA